jgi:hypothetical protein
MIVMSSHFERLNKIGERALGKYKHVLAAVAAISAAVAVVLVYSAFTLEGGDQSGLSIMVIQLVAAFSSSLAASALVAIAILYAAKRLLAAYIALVLHEVSAKAPETAAEPVLAAQVKEAAIARQHSKSEAIAQPASVTSSTPRAMTEKKKCPYCGRVLPFGDVHVVCPYCGRRLK